MWSITISVYNILHYFPTTPEKKGIIFTLNMKEQQVSVSAIMSMVDTSRSRKKTSNLLTTGLRQLTYSW